MQDVRFSVFAGGNIYFWGLVRTLDGTVGR